MEVILVDTDDKQVGTMEKMEAHWKGLLHRAFSVFIFNSKDELLMQQRASDKYHSGGLWTNTCCSHPRPDETVLQAGERRLQEEFGFTTTLQDVGWFHYQVQFANGLSENELDHVLIGSVPTDILLAPHPDEIHHYRWITPEALQQELHTHPEQFTYWFQQAWQIACQHIDIS